MFFLKKYDTEIGPIKLMIKRLEDEKKGVRDPGEKGVLELEILDLTAEIKSIKRSRRAKRYKDILSTVFSRGQTPLGDLDELPTYHKKISKITKSNVEDPILQRDIANINRKLDKLLEDKEAYKNVQQIQVNPLWIIGLVLLLVLVWFMFFS